MEKDILKSIKNADGIITRWPKRKEEKEAVLKYISSKFETEKTYSEREVNEIINRWHSFGDYALVRREMYDHFLLNRTPDGKAYWIETEDGSMCGEDFIRRMSQMKQKTEKPAESSGREVVPFQEDTKNEG